MRFNIINPELRYVWLNEAKQTVLDDKNIEDFYRKSGNKFIINQILQQYLKPFEPKLVFFEHSYFATTLDENNYTIFTCIWKKEQLSDIQLKKFHSFFNDMDRFENDYPILWHPEFFISPENYNFCLSQSGSSERDPEFDVHNYVKEAYQGKKNIFKVPGSSDGESVYVGSFTFLLAFEEKVQDIIDQKGLRDWQPILENSARIRMAYDTVFDKEEDEYSYKLAIPILGSPIDEESKYIGQGSIWIYIISSKPVEMEVLRILAIEIARHFKDISINYIFQSGLKLAKTSIKQATRAAISQVMARNMSHNIGSHVLSKVHGFLLKSERQPDLEKAAHLYEFIQKRMEFIANGINSSFETSHLLFEEVLPAYLNNTDREQVKRENLKMLFDNISGNNRVRSDNIFFNKSQNDILVSIPNGTLGFHALYTLLENIIRNSVKHNQAYPENGTLHYDIKIEADADAEYKNYYKVTVTDNFGKINANRNLDVSSLNDNLNLPVLSNGSLRPNYWGLLEMKICAAYLLGLPIDLIDSANIKNGKGIEISGIRQVFPPALIISEDSDRNLLHTFYLQKPKIAALTGNGFEVNEAEGIELVTAKGDFDIVGSRHHFVVFEQTELESEHEKKTNQRSVFFDVLPGSKVSINEPKLWNKYSEQKGWSNDDINIVSVRHLADQAFEINSDEKYIVLDDHDTWARDKGGKELLIAQPAQFPFYEAVNGLSSTNLAVCNKIPKNISEIDPILKARIFEMAFTTVMVLDERIQKNYGKERLETDHIRNPMFSNLFIPPLEGQTDLDKATTGDISAWAETIFALRKTYKINYLIIHRSLIGKERIVIDELKEQLKPNFTIFVSGGGTPPNLRDEDFYLPFDVLNYCLGSNSSKFALMSVLKSLRK